MRAYLLICFFLLFYSISSNTKFNYQDNCEKKRKECISSCKKFANYGSYKECKIKCNRDYFKCTITSKWREG